MATEDLQPSASQATPEQIYTYQQRVSSINFAVIITQPDIARAASKLAQFLTNPSNKHLQAVNRVIYYLYRFKILGLEYSGTNFGLKVLNISSNAAFGDNIDIKKSLDGFLMQLYGGPIN